MRAVLLLVLLSFSTLVECIIPLNILQSIIDHFKLFDVEIQPNCFTVSVKMELFKLFAKHGEMINFNEKIVHPSIRCTETISELMLNKPIKTKTVVVSQIENEVDLLTVNVSIGEEVYFLDKNTFKIYEAYVINNVHIKRYLGQFNQINKRIALFSPSYDFVDSFLDRRGDFQGIQLIVMTEQWLKYIWLPDNFADQSTYFPENETYDVTNIVSGSYKNALSYLEKALNFSTKLYKRKDGVWGMPKIMSNGSTHLNGMLKSITESHIDMIGASLSILQLRLNYVDYLVPMSQTHASLFIKNNDKFNMIDWSVYLTPFSIWSWLIIIISAMIFMFIISIMEWLFNVEMVSCNFRFKKKRISYFN